MPSAASPLAVRGWDPSTIAFLSQWMEALKPQLDAYDARAAYAHEQAGVYGPQAAQAETQLNSMVARGTPQVGPAEAFGRRLAGGISSAIAPQMQGQQLAEAGIDDENTRMRQNHTVKLQRMEQLYNKLAEKAAKFGDMEQELKFRKEEFKVAEQLKGLGEAEQHEQALRTRQQAERQFQYNKQKGELRDRQAQYEADMQRAFKNRQAAQDEVNRAIAGTKDKNGRTNKDPVRQELAKKALQRAHEEYTNAELKWKAWQAATVSGSFDMAAWKDAPKDVEELWSKGHMKQQIDTQVFDWMQNNKGTLQQLEAGMDAMSEDESGLPMDIRERRAVRSAWYAIKSWMDSSQAATNSQPANIQPQRVHGGPADSGMTMQRSPMDEREAQALEALFQQAGLRMLPSHRGVYDIMPQSRIY